MIKTKEELKFYIDADLRARFGENYYLSFGNKVSSFFFPRPWKYQILLRKAEYYCNSKNRIKRHIIGKYWKFRAYRYGHKCGYSISLNVFGPGLVLGHVGTVVVNGAVRFGSNVRIQACVNIGAFSKFDENWKENSTPKFGNNIYIGPGAKIFGDIEIGDNVAIGANAIVSKSIPDHCTVIGANQISNMKGSIDMLRYGDETKIPIDSYSYKVKHNL